MFGVVESVLALIGLIAGLYYYLTRNYDYWESRGVKGPKPVVFFGTVKNVILQKYSLGVYVNNLYNEWKEVPFVGIYLQQSPGRGMPMFEKVELLSAHLFNLEPSRWKSLRLKLSPVFTPRKLKEMFYLLVECGEHLDKYIDDIFDKSGSNEMVLECRELMAKFTTDVTGVCAFGLQMNALASENSTFCAMGKRIFATDWKKVLQFRLRTLVPKLYEMIGHLLIDREMDEFFIKTMTQTMYYGKRNNVTRHDFIDLLMAIRDHPDKMTEIIKLNYHRKYR